MASLTRILSLFLAGAFVLAPGVCFGGSCVTAQDITTEAAVRIASDPDQAIIKLRKAIKLCPESAAVNYNLGLALYNRGDYKDAEKHFIEATVRNPAYALAYNALAVINIEQSRLGPAMEYALKALKVEPNDAEFAETLASIKEELSVDIPPKTVAHRQDAVAVVIGNGDYENRLVPKVEYAGGDASAMKAYLVDTLGFREENIIYFENAKKTDFLKTFGDDSDYRGDLYSRTKNGASAVFVFFSGHGAPETNSHKAYLVPSDADPNSLKFSSYSRDTLLNNLAKLNEDKRPKQIVVVFEACFSGGYNEGSVLQDASPMYIEVENPVLKMDNAVVFSSSKGKQISSWYREQKHGLFTYFFLKALKNAARKGKALSAGDIEIALSDEGGVDDTAWKLYKRNQDPQVTGNRDIMLLSTY